MIQTIVAFVVVLAVLIFVHELGHFLVARLCRVRVLTFAIGFGPTLLARRRGDTEYALKAFPLGGYVKMFGEETDQTLSPEERAVAFSHKTVWERAAIVFAGPLFNLLTAVLIFWAVFVWGVPVLTSQVGEIQAGSAAAEAGLVTGDTIAAIDGQKVTEWEQIRARVQELGGRPMAVTVERDGKMVDLTVTPRRTQTQTIFGEPTEAWLIGISPQGTTVTVRHGLFEGAWLGLKRTYEVTHLTVLGIVKLIQRAIPSDTIGGPILIAQMAGEQASLGFMNVLLFVALLSVNLGVLNLLPIPVLDGGHLMFLAAEAVRGRPVSLKVRELAQQAGLFLLLALMAFAFYNDIMRFFTQPG